MTEIDEESRANTNWVLTFTGKKFYPLAPWPADVCIEDIAHSLSCQGRFTGHTRAFYSTAEHSVRVSRIVEYLGGSRRNQLHGLLHDGGEAYMADMARPIKHDPSMHFYRQKEQECGSIVCQSFGLDAEEPPIVKRADSTMLGIESRDLMRPDPAWGKWQALIPSGCDVKITKPWTPDQAERIFLVRYRMLRATP